MNDTEIDARFRRLERENRILKLVAGCLASTLTLVFLAGAKAPPETLDEVRAKRVVVVDSNGRERSVIEVPTKDDPIWAGSPQLRFKNARGQIALRLGVNGEGADSYANFQDDNGVLRTELSVKKDDASSRYRMYDARGRARLELFAEKEELSGLRVLQSAGAPIGLIAR